MAKDTRGIGHEHASQRLKDAQAKAAQLKKVLDNEHASLEGLVQARKRAHGIADNLRKNTENEAQKKLIGALQGDIKSFSKRIDAQRKKRKAQETTLGNVQRRIDHLTQHLHRGNFAMFDDVTVSLLPAGAKAYAGYIDGLYANVNDIKARFPNAKVFTIAVSAAHDADILDCETGDATVDQCAGWVHRQNGKGRKAIVYTSVANVMAVYHACAGTGLTYGKDYIIWSAHYGIGKHVCSPTCGYGLTFKVAGTQFTETSGGASLDESFCTAAFHT